MDLVMRDWTVNDQCLCLNMYQVPGRALGVQYATDIHQCIISIYTNCSCHNIFMHLFTWLCMLMPLTTVSRGYTQRGRRCISELQSSTNHNLMTQAAFQPTHNNMESPSIDFLLLNSHDEDHDIAIDGESNRIAWFLAAVTSIEESLPSSQPESSQISNHGATIRWTQ